MQPRPESDTASLLGRARLSRARTPDLARPPFTASLRDPRVIRLRLLRPSHPSRPCKKTQTRIRLRRVLVLKTTPERERICEMQPMHPDKYKYDSCTGSGRLDENNAIPSGAGLVRDGCQPIDEEESCFALRLTTRTSNNEQGSPSFWLAAVQYVAPDPDPRPAATGRRTRARSCRSCGPQARRGQRGGGSARPPGGRGRPSGPPRPSPMRTLARRGRQRRRQGGRPRSRETRGSSWQSGGTTS